MNVRPARLNIIVEGQTEEAFIRDVLAPHLNARSVFVSYRRVETSRRKEKITGQLVIFRGGITTYARLRNDILRWLREDSAAFLTTMIDVYALPSDFPRLLEARAKSTPFEKVRVLEESFLQDIGEPKFIPYLQLHEYEALLFSDVRITNAGLRLFDGRSREVQLQAIRTRYDTPEHIDEGPTTAPSKQIKSLFPAYDKLLFGPLIAATIGLEKIRVECPHFNEWITRLEMLR